MKKYNKPAIVIVKIASRTMIAASPIGISNEKVSAESAEGRRGGSSWDDEE